MQEFLTTESITCKCHSLHTGLFKYGFILAILDPFSKPDSHIPESVSGCSLTELCSLCFQVTKALQAVSEVPFTCEDKTIIQEVEMKSRKCFVCLRSHSNTDLWLFPVVLSLSIAYILFTSGTTGQPKQV